MTDYSKMSDFEINCSVLEFFEPEVEHMCLSVDGKSLYHCGLDGNGFHEVVIPDYCNSCTDAWPIIQNTKINIEFDLDETIAWAYDKNAQVISERDSKTFRAAMIVFLMMKEQADG